MNDQSELFKQLPSSYPYYMKIKKRVLGRGNYRWHARYADDLRVIIWFNVDSFKKDTGMSIQRSPYSYKEDNRDIWYWNKSFKILTAGQFEKDTGIEPNHLETFARLTDGKVNNMQEEYNR